MVNCSIIELRYVNLFCGKSNYPILLLVLNMQKRDNLGDKKNGGFLKQILSISVQVFNKIGDLSFE